MRKAVLVSVVILLATVTVAQAELGPVKGSIGATYTSKYIWRGFDVFDNKSAIHPFVDVDLFGTGFNFNATAHRANTSGHELNERWDYCIYYRNSAFQGEVYQTNYLLGYVYYNYPDRSSHSKDSLDLQEVNAVFSWPNLLPVKGLVASYVPVKLWPSNSGTPVGAASPTGGTASGWAHIFMLDYALPVKCPLTEKEQTFNFHSEFVYNDGLSPLGTNVDQDWSNAVFGVSTSFDLGNNVSFTPAVYYQSSWDDSVNDDDEVWASMTFKYSF